jgi:uncharacterized delta-60 repeat protein
MNRLRLVFLLVGVALVAPSMVSAQLDTVWLRQYDGSELDEDWMSDMAVDTEGNIYICGMAYAGNGSEDILLQKWSRGGDLLWEQIYNGDENDEDSAAAMVLDMDNNVYVCGWSYHFADKGMDLFVIKYSPEGDSLWQRYYNQAGAGDDAALDICLAGPEAVAVTGYTTDSTVFNIDYITILFNRETGDTVWTRRYNHVPENDEDVAVAIDSDRDGNVFVTGFSYDDDADYDIATVKYEPDGSRAWIRRHHHRPAGEDDYGMGIVYDPETDGIVVGGYVYTDNHDYDYFTMKYSQEGDSIWARLYNRYPENDEDLLMAVAVDRTGNVYVTGTSYGGLTDYDVATVSYDSDGLQRWVSRYDFEEWEDAGLFVTVDSMGQAFVTGYAEGLDTDYDIVLLKYTGDGSILWSHTYDNPTTNFEDYGTRVLPTFDGDIYLAGTTEDDSTDMDFVLIRYRELVHDFGVSAVFVPESLMLGDSSVPAVVVRNNAFSLDSCWLQLTVRSADYPGESLFVTLHAYAEDTVEFPTWYPSLTGVFDFTCWSELPEDEQPLNDTAWASVIVWDDTTGIVEQPGNVGVFDFMLVPNPARSVATVRSMLPTGEPAELKLYDVTGSLVACNRIVRVSTGVTALQLDVRRLPAGVYFVQLRQGERELSRKLVIQR